MNRDVWTKYEVAGEEEIRLQKFRSETHSQRTILIQQNMQRASELRAMVRDIRECTVEVNCSSCREIRPKFQLGNPKRRMCNLYNNSIQTINKEQNWKNEWIPHSRSGSLVSLKRWWCIRIWIEIYILYRYKDGSTVYLITMPHLQIIWSFKSYNMGERVPKYRSN